MEDIIIFSWRTLSCDLINSPINKIKSIDILLIKNAGISMHTCISLKWAQIETVFWGAAPNTLC